MTAKNFSKYSAPWPQDNLKIVSCCPFCSNYFSPLDAEVVEEAGNIHLLHIICRHCFGSMVILVLGSELGVSSIGLVTDLTSEEVARFKNEPAVSADEVIATHSYLRTVSHFSF